MKRINLKKREEINYFLSNIYYGPGTNANNYDLSTRMFPKKNMCNIKEYDREKYLSIISDFLKGCNLDSIFNPQNQENHHPPLVLDPNNWLGCYYVMKKNEPGIIELNYKPMLCFIWSITYQLLYNKNKHCIDRETFRKICQVLVNKTLYHELFHHYSDFVRIYTNGRSVYDYETEEAMAVAFSRIHLETETNQKPLFTDLLNHAFKYTGRGYKDWSKYHDEHDFISKLIEYSNFQPILNTGNTNNLPEISKTLLESIVNNPNVFVQGNYK